MFLVHGCFPPLVHRQAEAEPGALARLAFHPDSAAVRLDDAAADGQPQSGPFSASGLATVTLEKAFEYPLVNLPGNADTLVGHAHDDLLAVPACPHHAA